MWHLHEHTIIVPPEFLLSHTLCFIQVRAVHAARGVLLPHVLLHTQLNELPHNPHVPLAGSVVERIPCSVAMTGQRGNDAAKCKTLTCNHDMEQG